MRGHRGIAAQAAQIVLLALLWVLLWGDLSAANALSGLLLGGLLVLGLPLPSPQRRVRVSLWHSLRLLAWFLAELISSAWMVAWRAVRVGRPPVNAVVSVTLRTRSDRTLTVVALAMTAIPGSLVLEVRRSTATLYMHVLGPREGDVREAIQRDLLDLERRVIRAMGDEEDRRLLREGGRS